jgi:hypothetical protein
MLRQGLIPKQKCHAKHTIDITLRDMRKARRRKRTTKEFCFRRGLAVGHDASGIMGQPVRKPGPEAEMLMKSPGGISLQDGAPK